MRPQQPSNTKVHNEEPLGRGLMVGQGPAHFLRSVSPDRCFTEGRHAVEPGRVRLGKHKDVAALSGPIAEPCGVAVCALGRGTVCTPLYRACVCDVGGSAMPK